MRVILSMIFGFLCIFAVVYAVNAQNALVVQTCGTLPQAYAVGSTQQATVDVNGKLCTTSRTTPGYLAGKAYPAANGAEVIAAVPTLDTVVFLYPFSPIDEPITAVSLNTRVGNGVALCEIKMAVFAHSLTTKRPTGTPIVGSNTGQACATNGTTQTIAVNFTFRNGTVYWAAVAVSTGASQMASYNLVLAPAVGFASLFGQVGGPSNVSGFGGILSAPYAYATNIMTLDLTAATFTDVTTTGVPVLFIGT